MKAFQNIKLWGASSQLMSSNPQESSLGRQITIDRLQLGHMLQILHVVH